MSDLKLNTDGDITGEILTDENDISLQRVLHILRSYEGDHPLTDAYGNPSGVSDRFNVELFLNTFQLQLDSMIESDEVINGIFSVKLNYDSSTNNVTINIINNTTGTSVNTFNMDYYGKLNKPIDTSAPTEHSSINSLKEVSDDGYIYINNCSFINKKLVYVGLEKPQLKIIQKQLNLQNRTSIQEIINKEIKRYSYYIDYIGCEQFQLTFEVTNNDIIVYTDGYTDDVILTIKYSERNSNDEPVFSSFLSQNKRPIMKNLNIYNTKILIPGIDITKKYYVISGIKYNAN